MAKRESSRGRSKGYSSIRGNSAARVQQSQRANVRSNTVSGQAANRNAEVLARWGSSRARNFNAQISNANAPNMTSAYTGRPVYAAPPGAPNMTSAATGRPVYAPPPGALNYTPAGAAAAPVEVNMTQAPVSRIGYSEATPEQSAAMSSERQFGQGVEQGFTGEMYQGRDPETLTGPESGGYIVGSLAGAITGGRGRLISNLNRAQQWVRQALSFSQRVPAPLAMGSRLGQPATNVGAKTTGELVAKNSKNAKAAADHATKTLMRRGLMTAGASMLAFSILMNVFTSKGTAEYVGSVDNPQGYGFAAYLAMANDHPELALQVVEESRQVYEEPGLMGELFGWFPGINVGAESIEYKEGGGRALLNTVEYIARDNLEKIETGTTDAEMWMERDAQKQAQWEENFARQEQRDAAAQAQWEANQAVIAQAQEQRQLADAENRAFWDAYLDRKAAEQQRIEDYQRIRELERKQGELSFSTLNFGLL